VTTEPKPLSVGDRVRVIGSCWWAEPAIGTEWTVTRLGIMGDGWLGAYIDDPECSYMYRHELEIVGEYEFCARNRIGACGDANKPFRELAAEASREFDTLTAERDAARAERDAAIAAADAQLERTETAVAEAAAEYVDELREALGWDDEAGHWVLMLGEVEGLRARAEKAEADLAAVQAELLDLQQGDVP